MTDSPSNRKSNPKPWHTKDWGDMRNRRIGDRCEQCGSTDGPLVLQHLSHEGPEPPDSKDTVIWNLMREYGSYPPRPTVQRQACPQCNRCSLTERKKLKPKWRCIACHHEFDESIMVEIPINNRTEKGEYDRYRQEVLFPAFNDFVDAHQDIVEQRYTAVLADYEQERRASDDRYMSGEGTVTFCKKCAFLWDVKEQELCSQCKKRYHSFKYATCYECLPQSFKDALREQRLDEDMMEECIEETMAEVEKALEEAEAC